MSPPLALVTRLSETGAFFAAPFPLPDLPLLVMPASDSLVEIIWFTAIPVALGFLVKFYRDWQIGREPHRRHRHRHARRPHRPRD